MARSPRGEPLARTNANHLTVTGDEHLGALHSDSDKLRQILLNLINNACKFTRSGEVHVRCHRERDAPSDWIVIDIEDSGIGMTPEQMEGLFSEFMQADYSMTRRFGGTGLGLAISQRLCRMLGGEILAGSHAGRGSTFTVRLPARIVGTSHDGAVGSPAPPTGVAILDASKTATQYLAQAGVGGARGTPSQSDR